VSDQRATTGADPAPRWKLIAAGLAHAFLLILAFAPPALTGFVLLAPVPLLWAATIGAGRPFRAALWAALGVIPFWAFEQQWVWNVSVAGYPPMVLMLSAFNGALVWTIARVHRRWPSLPLTLFAPLLWAGMETFRGEIAFDGYPWYLLAHPIIDAGPLAPLAQWASVAGVYPVSFLTALPAAAALDAARALRKPSRAVVVSAASATLVFITAILLAPHPPVVAAAGSEWRIAVLQTNVPSDNKTDWKVEDRVSDLRRFASMTLDAASATPPPDLIVWPETMFPGTTLDPAAVAREREAELGHYAVIDDQEVFVPTTWFHDEFLALQDRVNIPIVVGAIDLQNLRAEANDQGQKRLATDASYNAAYLVRDGRVEGEAYRKMHLTPFGEVMPYISAWPWLERQLLMLGANGMAFDLSAGKRPTLLNVSRASDSHAIATPICFEATSTRVCRRLVFGPDGRRADLLINLTNDGWFGSFDAARRHHLQAARWRCVELRTPMIRAANTGISAAIDPAGRVFQQGPDNGANPARSHGVMTVEVAPGSTTPPYANVGRTPAWILAALAALLVGATFSPRPRPERTEEPAEDQTDPEQPRSTQ